MNKERLMTVLIQPHVPVKCDTVKDGSLDKLDFTCQMNLGKLCRRNNTFEREKVRMRNTVLLKNNYGM